jgi:hypothetical protein
VAAARRDDADPPDETFIDTDDALTAFFRRLSGRRAGS